MATRYQTTIKGLPVYEAGLDDKGLIRVSLVTSPAVCKDFEAYASLEPVPALYAVEDEDRRLAFGVLMRANYPIYRRSGKGFEYFITHSPEMIREMAEQFIADGNANRIDLQHDGEEVDGVQLVQLFIKDSAKGISPAGFEEIEDGSLFGEYHVTNDEAWAGIKDGTFRGFSVEVFETVTESNAVVSEEKIDPEILDYLGKFAGLIKSNEKNNMNFWEKFKAAVDAAVVEDKTANPSPEAFGRVSTDKGVLAWDGDEPLKEGDAVSVVAEDGSLSTAPDDTYTVEDGKQISVVGGKVASITDPSAEVTEGEGNEPAGEQQNAAADPAADSDEYARFSARRAEYEASYDERYRAIADAFAAAGLEAWIDEASDTWAVVEIWADGWKMRRYAITVGEDLHVTLGEYVEVKRAYVPADLDVESMFSAANPAGTDGESAELEAARTRIAELEAEVERLGKQPVTPSAREQFRRESAGTVQQTAADAFSRARRAAKKN